MDIIRTLLEYGADPNAVKAENVAYVPSFWETALIRHEKRPELLMMLLEYGADPFLPRLDSLFPSKDMIIFLETKRKQAKPAITRIKKSNVKQEGLKEVTRKPRSNVKKACIEEVTEKTAERKGKKNGPRKIFNMQKLRTFGNHFRDAK
jgi:hypothetical protein